MITTDTQGLTAGEVKIPTKDGEGSIPAYRAQPAGKTGLPTVLVVQEIFGVHEYIKDVTRRLAKQGYLAIAPELYARQGDVSTMSVPDILANVVSKVPDAQVMADLDASVAWAAKNGGGGKLGITGFCWGGRIVWMYAAHNPSLAAGVAWYGNVATGRYPGDKGAIDVVDRIKAPVLGLYGAADSGIPNDDGGEAARGAEGGGQHAQRDHSLPGHAPRVPCGLPAELSQGAGGGRLEAPDSVVQAVPGVTQRAGRA